MLHTRSTSYPVAHGFTLLELMLVLALMAVIGSLAIPRMGDVFERQRVNGAATELRLAWDEARLEAMRTGQAQVFECSIGTNEFTVKPLMLNSDMTEAAAGAEVMTGVGTVVETQDNGMLAAAAPPSDPQSDKLDEKISFVSCQVASDLRSYSVAEESANSGTGQLSTQTVGQQVIFYPDGSTSTAEVQIKNERGEIRGVRIRGLTGHSKIVEILNVASNTESTTGGSP